MALTQVSTDGIKNGTITGTDLATNVDLVDNQKLRVGTGNDLNIFHDGNGSYLLHNGTGFFLIEGNGTNNLNIRAKSGENSIICIPDAAVELYHNHSKKFETTSTGATVTGDLVPEANDTRALGTGSLQWAQSNIRELKLYEKSIHYDNVKALFGHGEDLEIYHDGTDSIIDNTTNSLKFIAANDVEAIKIFSDGTVNIGNNADNVKLRFGIGSDLQIYHDGSNSYVSDNGTGNLKITSNGTAVQIEKSDGDNMAVFRTDGAVELYHANSKKIETTSSGISVAGNAVVSGNVQINDNNFLNIGNSGDMQILFNGTDSAIRTDNDFKIEAKDGGKDMIHAIATGAVELHYNGSRKFETNNLGCKILGQLGIGISSPAALTHIYDDTNTSSITEQLRISGGDRSADSFETGIRFFTQSPSTNGNRHYRITANGNVGLTIQGHETSTGNAAGDRHVLLSPSGGNVLIGTTSVDGDGISIRPRQANATSRLIFNRANTTDSGTAVQFLNNSVTVGAIRHTNSSTTYATTSDYRLKENATVISDGIARLKTLKPYRFNFKVDASKTVDGFFAHEVTAVPEAITGEKDAVNEDGSIDPQGIDQSKLVPLLVAAVQELIGKVEGLQTEVAALKVS